MYISLQICVCQKISTNEKKTLDIKQTKFPTLETCKRNIYPIDTTRSVCIYERDDYNNIILDTNS